jgi:hypothetical protein
MPSAEDYEQQAANNLVVDIFICSCFYFLICLILFILLTAPTN